MFGFLPLLLQPIPLFWLSPADLRVLISLCFCIPFPLIVFKFSPIFHSLLLTCTFFPHTLHDFHPDLIKCLLVTARYFQSLGFLSYIELSINIRDPNIFHCDSFCLLRTWRFGCFTVSCSLPIFSKFGIDRDEPVEEALYPQ